jgi:hypothetical protein
VLRQGCIGANGEIVGAGGGLHRGGRGLCDGLYARSHVGFRLVGRFEVEGSSTSCVAVAGAAGSWCVPATECVAVARASDFIARRLGRDGRLSWVTVISSDRCE